MPDPSDVDRNNQVDQSSSAKKSTGLKCIAKQVIDIMKSRAYMSYNQVASIVVTMRLKTPGSPKFSDGLCSQSNILENDSCWDESNLATSAKKKRRSATPAAFDGDNHNPSNETPAKRRSREESNLRRRIYDAWNVLKAASIIIEHDEKHYKYNPAILKEEQELERLRLQEEAEREVDGGADVEEEEMLA